MHACGAGDDLMAEAYSDNLDAWGVRHEVRDEFDERLYPGEGFEGIGGWKEVKFSKINERQEGG